MNQELSDVQAGFIKGRGTRDHIANIRWITEKASGLWKNIYFCFTDYEREWTSWLIFLGSKITADGACSHEITRCLLLRRKSMTKLDSILKSRDITLLTNFHIVKAMKPPVAHMVKNLPVRQETRVRSLGWEFFQRRKWQSTPVFLPREFHGQRSLEGYSPRSSKDRTQLSG